jgi:hypothetical protein
MSHSAITAIKQSQYTQSSLRSRFAEAHTRAAMPSYSQARCVKPDVPVSSTAYTENTLWPHQVVNVSCPRFAMFTLTTSAGLGHRFQEVSTIYILVTNA